MKALFGILVLSFFVSVPAYAKEEDMAFQAVDNLFLAMSNLDHNKMRESVEDTFVLLEHGEIWSIEDLINVVTPSDYVRTNYFSIINIDIRGTIAVVNYWNKANFDNKKNSQDAIWLESAVVLKRKGVWLLSQMHSTRLPSGKTPKNVVFKKQKI